MTEEARWLTRDGRRGSCGRCNAGRPRPSLRLVCRVVLWIGAFFVIASCAILLANVAESPRLSVPWCRLAFRLSVVLVCCSRLCPSRWFVFALLVFAVPFVCVVICCRRSVVRRSIKLSSWSTYSSGPVYAICRGLWLLLQGIGISRGRRLAARYHDSIFRGLVDRRRLPRLGFRYFLNYRCSLCWSRNAVRRLDSWFRLLDRGCRWRNNVAVELFLWRTFTPQVSYVGR
jgi:hypothetical protein